MAIARGRAFSTARKLHAHSISTAEGTAFLKAIGEIAIFMTCGCDETTPNEHLMRERRFAEDVDFPNNVAGVVRSSEEDDFPLIE